MKFPRFSLRSFFVFSTGACLYICGYSSMLVPTRSLEGTQIKDKVVLRTHWHARYKFLDPVCSTAFAPIHFLDKLLRPSFWNGETTDFQILPQEKPSTRKMYLPIYEAPDLPDDIY